ncbi:hypothetical protein BGV46_25265 [Serratia marcescens]|nr:hypothetical protein RN42_25405 [Serratia marcescens]OHT35989.1 hypothetical protein BGV45_25260 [Serratia marcescens]OHT38047.1 hypothetical protein BGV46_25265 [Serratia marcescens]
MGVERAEYTDYLLACPAEHGAGGAAKHVIEQGPVVVEERPQLLQALDLQLRQKKREWVQSGEAHAHAAGEHALDGEFGPVAEGVTVFVEIAAPAIIVLEQQLCRSGNIHGAESTGRQGTGKGRRRQPACSFYAGVSAAVGHVPPRGSWCVQAVPALR